MGIVYGYPPESIAMKITEVVWQILRISNIQAKSASSQDSVIVRNPEPRSWPSRLEKTRRSIPSTWVLNPNLSAARNTARIVGWREDREV
jgi:hypothetical protein